MSATSGEEALMKDRQTIEHRRRRLSEYAERVARGEGFMPWQEREAVSPEEREFRETIEQLKTDMLAQRMDVQHPVMLTAEQIEQARRNIEHAPWAKKWLRETKQIADHVVQQDADYVEKMIPELTPTNPYGVTCPNCVGRLTQECSIYYNGVAEWDHHQPEVIRCRACGQALPDAKFPETGRLAW